MQGQVIGINSQIADSGIDANVGVGFAIPIDMVKQIASDLQKTAMSRTPGSASRSPRSTRRSPTR